VRKDKNLPWDALGLMKREHTKREERSLVTGTFRQARGRQPPKKFNVASCATCRGAERDLLTGKARYHEGRPKKTAVAPTKHEVNSWGPREKEGNA